MTTRINIATASVLLSFAIAAAMVAPTASAARGAKSTIKHHSQPRIHVKVPGASHVGIPGPCISAYVEEYLAVYTCNGGLPSGGTATTVPAVPVEAEQPFSLLQPATVVASDDGSAADSSMTADSSGGDASDSC